MNAAAGAPEAWEAIRLIMEVWSEHRVDGDETRPLRHLRTGVIRYFRAVSRNYVNMIREEKWHLCKRMAFEALESLDGEKPKKKWYEELDDYTLEHAV